MKVFCVTIFACLLLFLSCKKGKENQVSLPEPKFLIKGFDLSFLPQLRASGLPVYNLNGQQEDMLLSLKNAGVNTIRLRLWKNPDGGFSGLEEVKKLSNEVKLLGLKVWLTVHYSDTWADPGAQTKPVAWNGISYAALKDSVRTYTLQIMNEINPDYIQIGNEVNNGFLWPEGKLDKVAQFKELYQAGANAVRETNPGTKIILHYAGYENVLDYLNFIGKVDADIIGLSYYPMWHGKNLDSLKLQMSSVASISGKGVMIAEASYPFTLGWNDWTNNVLGDSSQLISGFPATALGQKEFVTAIKQISTQANNGVGFCYWGGEWISFKGNTSTEGSSYENQAMWDFNGKALPVLKAYK